MKFYWGSGSPFAWRAMLGLVLKGIEFESTLLQFSKGEHRAPGFLALNPRGKVPVLVDGDEIIYESLAILAYLERKQPEPALFGKSPAQHALIWRLISEHESYVAPIGERFARPVYFGKLDEKKDQVKSAADEIQTELARLEEHLAKRTFLAGDAVTAADAVYYPTIQQLLRVLSKPDVQALDLGLHPLEQRYPNIGAWKQRVDALPGVDSTYPPHWRE